MLCSMRKIQNSKLFSKENQTVTKICEAMFGYVTTGNLHLKSKVKFIIKYVISRLSKYDIFNTTSQI